MYVNIAYNKKSKIAVLLRQKMSKESVINFEERGRLMVSAVSAVFFRFMTLSSRSDKWLKLDLETLTESFNFLKILLKLCTYINLFFFFSRYDIIFLEETRLE